MGRVCAFGWGSFSRKGQVVCHIRTNNDGQSGEVLICKAAIFLAIQPLATWCITALEKLNTNIAPKMKAEFFRGGVNSMENIMTNVQVIRAVVLMVVE
jgi:hypothetical protein